MSALGANLPSWTDAHCHLQDPKLGTGLQEVLRRSETFSIRRWVVNGTHPGDWHSVAELARTHPGIIPQFGVHPWKSQDLPADWEVRLREYLLRFPEAGIGEIGLDRKLTTIPISIQSDVCLQQIKLAEEFRRPCTLHVIAAWAELEQILQEVRPKRFLLHSFGGSAEQVRHYAQHGAWFSFGGAVIRQASDKLQTAIQAVPEDQLLLETDAPFQHPEGKDRIQEPAGLLRIAEKVASIRGVNVDVLRQQTEENATRFLTVS